MKRIRVLPPKIERLRELFSYDPITGALWRHGGGKPIGQGCVKCILVKVDGQMFGAHRIAWALTHGEWPVAEVDHVNCNPVDNRLCNLRQATSAQNCQNRRMDKRNKSGVKGVCRVKGGTHMRWRVSVCREYDVYITHFQCFGQAIKHAAEMRKELHGNFARFV